MPAHRHHRREEWGYYDRVVGRFRMLHCSPRDPTTALVANHGDQVVLYLPPRMERGRWAGAEQVSCTYLETDAEFARVKLPSGEVYLAHRTYLTFRTEGFGAGLWGD